MPENPVSKSKDVYCKIMETLGEDLSKTIILDNSLTAFAYNMSNGIPILSYFDQQDDTELEKLLPVLDSLRKEEDVRPHIETMFELGQVVDNVILLLDTLRDNVGLERMKSFLEDSTVSLETLVKASIKLN